MASASLARHIAVVQQQNFLFTGTVLENLIAGWPGAMEADAVAALRTLDCEGLIDELPDGLPADGLLAEAGNRGGKVSLGQRQLLCFARAMVGDRSLLILDEATNAIGTLTELKMQAAFKKLLDGRTSVVIAHRLCTVRAADQLLVLDAGRCVQQGVHDDLFQQPEIYRAFVERTSG